MSNLFVYGTLLKGFGHPMHDVVSRFAELQGVAYINGKLYEIDQYPGLVLSNSSRNVVWGELYRVVDEPELFHYLDDYEGCADHSPRPHEYWRDLVSVYLGPDDSLLAWTYLYKQPVTELVHISDGDYLVYRNKGRLNTVNDK